MEGLSSYFSAGRRERSGSDPLPVFLESGLAFPNPSESVRIKNPERRST